MHPVTAALLGAHIRPVFSLLAPSGEGASTILVRHCIYARDHLESDKIDFDTPLLAAGYIVCEQANPSAVPNPYNKLKYLVVMKQNWYIFC